MRDHHFLAAVALLLPAVLLLASMVSAQPQRADAPIMINELACPANTITFEPGSDLRDNQEPNTTYLLQPGNYSLTGLTIDSIDANGTVLCYVGNGTTREDVLIDVVGRMFRITQGGALGLKGLVLDGRDRPGSPLPNSVFEGTLSTEDVTFQNLQNVAGVFMPIEASDVTFTKTRFKRLFGRLDVLTCVGGHLRMQEVAFERCRADFVSVLAVLDGCHVKLDGSSTVIDNKGGLSGFVYIGREGTLDVQGELCAQSNPGLASFANVVDGGTLRVADGASVQVDGDRLEVVVATFVDIDGVVSKPGRVFCGSNPSTTSWLPGSYDITGNLCACSEQFQLGAEGQARTCDGCRGAGWNPELCACKGECGTGPCCDIAKKAFRPKGQLCRRAQNSCEADSTCTGNSNDCPRVVAQNGKPCPYTLWDHKDFFRPLTADPATEPQAAVQSRRPGKSTGGEDSSRHRDPHQHRHNYQGAHNPQQPHSTETPSYDESSQLFYPSEGPSYHNPRLDHPGSYHARHGWPECWGTCSAGKCQLDKPSHGCCHLSRGQQGNYHGQGYASATAAVVGGSADGAVAPDDSSPIAHVADADSSSSIPAMYSNQGDSSLVCWDGQAL